MADLNKFFEQINNAYDRALKSESSDAYSNLSTNLGNADMAIREFVQEKSGAQIKEVIKKLEKAQVLTPQELSLIELWVVGDAKQYSQMENSFADWKLELNRLFEQLNKFRGKDPDIQTVMTMRGLLHDAVRVMSDIIYFVQQKERVDNFRNATKEIDAQERAILINLLTKKLKSWEF